MSVQAMTWVLDHSPATGTARLVLIAIANHAGKNPNDGAWEAWPGVETLRREANVSRTESINDALKRLVADEALERIVNGAPDLRIRPDRRPNLYRILLDHGRECDNPGCAYCLRRGDATRPPVETLRGDAKPENGGTRNRSTGGRDASPEPLVEPSENLFGEQGSPRARSRTVRDDLFDAIIIECSFSRPLTKSAGARVGRAVNELVAVDATAAEIAARANRYRTRFRGAVLTPEALTKHWPALAEARAGDGASSRLLDNLTRGATA